MSVKHVYLIFAHCRCFLYNLNNVQSTLTNMKIYATNNTKDYSKYGAD